jgi:hypothetical protein
MSLDIKIPAINVEWQVPSNQAPWREQAIATIKRIKASYLKEFQEASELTGVPLNILIAFCAVESGGAKNETLKGASKGVMQVNTDTAWQVINDQLKVSNLNNFYPLYQGCPSIFTLKKPLPKNFNPNTFVALKSTMANEFFALKKIDGGVLENIATCMTRSDARFSIIVGSYTLAQLINGTIKKTGQIRLDHIIIKYNAGTGRFRSLVTNKGLESSSVDTTQIYENVPIAITRAYIVKLLGINGYLDVLKRKLA